MQDSNGQEVELKADCPECGHELKIRCEHITVNKEHEWMIFRKCPNCSYEVEIFEGEQIE